MKKTFVYIITFLTFTVSFSYAQLSTGGEPKSFEFTGKATSPLLSASSLPIQTLPSIDINKLLLEDQNEEKMGVPQRFGYPFEVDYDLTNSGIWETAPDGTEIWRLQIDAPGAYSINLVYNQFYLNDDVTFYIYNADHSMLIGGFTSENNKQHGKFQTAPVKGDACILEVNVPPNVSYPGIISISTVVHAYRDLFKSTDDFNESGSCNNNVICPEWTDWNDQINSVAMVILGSGFRWCSGSMVNNARNDLTPYFLTANHCLSSPENFIIMYNYQSPTCTPNNDGPTYMTLQGTTLISTNAFSDFALLLLDNTPPDSFNVYYNGWSAEEIAATSTHCIHHPSGDVKKISYNDDPITSTSYFSNNSGGDNSHWRIDNWEDGTTEGGSSGSPLFDQNYKVIGQLHGGWAACDDIRADWFGKFSVSWAYGATPETRLKDWLDPDNTGILTLEGIDQSGLTFVADTTIGWVPLNVSFTANSKYTVSSWNWDFGDGDSATVQNPSHLYSTPGPYDIRLEISTGGDSFFVEKSNYIIALADTLTPQDTVGNPSESVEIVVSAHNNLTLERLDIPFEYSGNLSLSYDSMSTVGCRTDYFDNIDFSQFDAFNKRATVKLIASTVNTNPPLPVGDGPVIKLYFTVSASATPADTTELLFDGYTTYDPKFTSSLASYNPVVSSALVTINTSCCLGDRGNVDGDPQDLTDISDLLYLVDYSFASPSGPAPACLEEADVNADGSVDISDVLYLVDFMFTQPPGPAPVSCF